jgi:hypothetical protein
MASLENRSVSNLIEVMVDERWKRLAEQQGVVWRVSRTDFAPGEKCQSKNGTG